MPEKVPVKKDDLNQENPKEKTYEKRRPKKNT